MRVIAKKLGYYNHVRIKPGEEFMLKERKGLDREGKPVTLTVEQQFSNKWMELAEEAEAKAPSRSPAKSDWQAKPSRRAAKVAQAEDVDSDVI